MPLVIDSTAQRDLFVLGDKITEYQKVVEAWVNHYITSSIVFASPHEPRPLATNRGHYQLIVKARKLVVFN